MNIWLEKTLQDEFGLVKVIKQSNNTQIHLLRHKQLGKNIILRKFSGNADIYRILQTISQENIPRIFEITENSNDTIVLEEYIDGMTISDILDISLYKEDGVKVIASGLCNALHVLHSKGIIHRDIKPDNVMINSSGAVKLIDYGAARLFKFNRSEDTKIIGTPGYAAPEQFGFNQTDQRSDIFALGVLMNVMLTNEHPARNLFRGKLSKVIRKCIQVDPNRRYSSVLELKSALK